MFGRWRRRRRRVRIDPFAVGEPWRHLVKGALQARARYDRAVGGVAAGPLRERLDDIGRRIEEGTRQCWEVAQRGCALQDAVSTLDDGEAKVRLTAMVTDAQEQLARLEAGLGQAAAAAVELSARQATAVEATALGEGVEHLVDDVAVLRSALDEVAAPGHGPAA